MQITEFQIEKIQTVDAFNGLPSVMLVYFNAAIPAEGLGDNNNISIKVALPLDTTATYDKIITEAYSAAADVLRAAGSSFSQHDLAAMIKMEAGRIQAIQTF